MFLQGEGEEEEGRTHLVRQNGTFSSQQKIVLS